MERWNFNDSFEASRCKLLTRNELRELGCGRFFGLKVWDEVAG
jgi:hypothetical protein